MYWRSVLPCKEQPESTQIFFLYHSIVKRLTSCNQDKTNGNLFTP